jgi:hypothetical protein
MERRRIKVKYYYTVENPSLWWKVVTFLGYLDPLPRMCPACGQYKRVLLFHYLWKNVRSTFPVSVIVVLMKKRS